MLVVCLIFLAQTSQAQIVNEQTRKKFSFGIGMFTDIWNNIPDGFKTRDINQGFHAFAMYNVPFGKTNLGFSVGLGFRAQNLYVKDAIFNSTNDSTYLVAINDSISVKRSKLTLPYLELPVEFYFKSKVKVVAAVGFKIAYGLPAHTKYVGEDYNTGNGDEYRVKFREIHNVQRFSFGPTLRIGYQWIHVYGYYSLSKIFTKDKGPDMYPISVGLVLLPY